MKSFKKIERRAGDRARLVKSLPRMHGLWIQITGNCKKEKKRKEEENKIRKERKEES